MNSSGRAACGDVVDGPSATSPRLAAPWARACGRERRGLEAGAFGRRRPQRGPRRHVGALVRHFRQDEDVPHLRRPRIRSDPAGSRAQWTPGGSHHRYTQLGPRAGSEPSRCDGSGGNRERHRRGKGPAAPGGAGQRGRRGVTTLDVAGRGPGTRLGAGFERSDVRFAACDSSMMRTTWIIVYSSSSHYQGRLATHTPTVFVPRCTR